MTIILRLQGLPWSASSMDIREFFAGMSIPDGGVHIVGGETGDVFIAFSTDEDARKAMQKQSQPLCGSRVSILLSSKSEMQDVIAKSRSTTGGRREPFPPSSTSQQLSTTPSPTSPIATETSQVTPPNSSYFRTSTDHLSTVSPNRNGSKVPTDDPAVYGSYLAGDRYSSYGYAYGKPSDSGFIGNFEGRPTETTGAKSLDVSGQSVNVYGQTPTNTHSKSLEGTSSQSSEQWASEQDFYGYQRFEKDMRPERDQTYGHSHLQTHEVPLSNLSGKLSEGTPARGVEQFLGTYTNPVYSSYSRNGDKQQVPQKVDPGFQSRGDILTQTSYDATLAPGSERKSSTPVDLKNENKQRDQQKSIPPIPENLVERLRDVFPLTGLSKLGRMEEKKAPPESTVPKLLVAPSSESFQGIKPTTSYSVTGFNTSTVTRQKFGGDEYQQNIPYRGKQDTVNLPSSVSSSAMKNPEFSQFKNASPKLFPSAREKSFPEFASSSQRPFPAYGVQEGRFEPDIKPRPGSLQHDSRKGQQRDASKFASTDRLVHERGKRMEVRDPSLEGTDDDYFEDPAFPGKPLGFEEAIPSQQKDALLSDPYKHQPKANFDDPREKQFGRNVPSQFDRPPGRSRVSRFDESFDRSAHKSSGTFEKPFGRNDPGLLEGPGEKQFGAGQGSQKFDSPAEGTRRGRFDEPFNKPREPGYEKPFGREPMHGPDEPLLKHQTNPELRQRAERYPNENMDLLEGEEYGRRPVHEGPVGRFRERPMSFDEPPGNARHDREGMPYRFSKRSEFSPSAPLLGNAPGESMEKSVDRFPSNEFSGRHFGESHKDRYVGHTKEDVVVMDNLPIDCEEGNVLRFFHGLSIAPDGIRMQIDTNTRQKTGRALVQFVSVIDASDALKRSNETMKGRPITVSKCPLDEWNAATGGKVGLESKEERAHRAAEDKPPGRVEPTLEGPRSRPLLETEGNLHFMGRGPMPFRARGPRPILERAPRPGVDRGSRQRFEAEKRQSEEPGPLSHLGGQPKPLLEKEQPRVGRFPGPPLRARVPDHDARETSVRPPFLSRDRSPFRDSHTCIELRGLPFDAETKDIVDFFEGIQVARGSVFVERGTDGKVVGRCFLELADPTQLDLALRQNGKMMGNRSIDVSHVPHPVMLQRISEAEKRMADRFASLREEGKPSEISRDGKSSRERTERSRYSRDRDRDRTRERDRSRDSNRERERDRDRDRGRDRDRERDRERRDKDRSRDRDRSKERDRPRERDRNEEKDRKDDKDRKKENDRKGDDGNTKTSKETKEPEQPDKANQQPISKEQPVDVRPEQKKPAPLIPAADKAPTPAIGKEDSIPSLLGPSNPKISLPRPPDRSSGSSQPVKEKAATIGLLPEPDIPAEHKKIGYVLVRNVPYASTEGDILQFFAGLKVIPGGIHMIRLADGKFTGQAYIEFVDPSEAERAMERRHMVIRDRVIQISLTTKAAMMQAIRAPAQPPFSLTGNKPGPFLPPSRFDSGPPRPRLLRPGVRMGVPQGVGGRGCAIFVGNLNETVSVPMLGNLFADYSVVPGGIRIGVDPSGRPLGEAKVAFPNRDEAIRVVRELNGVMFAGRRLQLNVIS